MMSPPHSLTYNQNRKPPMMVAHNVSKSENFSPYFSTDCQWKWKELDWGWIHPPPEVIGLHWSHWSPQNIVGLHRHQTFFFFLISTLIFFDFFFASGTASCGWRSPLGNEDCATKGMCATGAGVCHGDVVGRGGRRSVGVNSTVTGTGTRR